MEPSSGMGLIGSEMSVRNLTLGDGTYRFPETLVKNCQGSLPNGSEENKQFTSSWIKRDQLDVTCLFFSLFNSQHVSDVNTSIFRSLRLLGALLCRLYCAVMIEVYVLIYLSSGMCYTYIMYRVWLWVSVFLQACGVLWFLNSLCVVCWWMDVLTSETRWTVNWHNKASVIKLVYLYSNIKMMHGPISTIFKERLVLQRFQRTQQWKILWIEPFHCK